MSPTNRGAERRLIPVLISEGIMTDEGVKQAQALSAKKGIALRDAILELKLATEEDLLYAYGTALNTTCITLTDFVPEQELISSVPADLARRYKSVPCSRVGNTLTLAMADPLDVEAIDAFRKGTGLDVTPVLASERDINEALNKYYGGKMEDLVQKLGDTYKAEHVEVVEIQEDVNETSAPVVQAVDRIISDGINAGASDIHIEPFSDRLVVRYRVDGILHEHLSLPKASVPAIVSRVKIMATLDITEKRLPQDGRIYFGKYNKKFQTIDLRISTTPTVFGEKVALRIINRGDVARGLDTLGFNRKNLEVYRKAIKAPYGMILHVGPTGSGKTTTLYAALTEVNDASMNIQTVEDPVEYQIRGISQTQVHPEIGLTFARALRSFLRQDPDVLMVGEIRDKETALIAVEAALTGHLLFSTLHTNDAVGTISRLVEMGIEPFLVGSSLLLVCAQRLMRRLCETCKQEVAIDDAHAKSFQVAGIEPIPQTVYVPTNINCVTCGGTGYKGRIGIHELLNVNAEVRQAITSGARDDEILAAAKRGGMTSLYQDAMRKVVAGVTSLEEAMQVVRSDEA